MGDQNSGGFNAGGSIQNTAGGDIVAGDKITTTTQGFSEPESKEEFLTQVEELRTALRDIKKQISDASQCDDDLRDELEAEILKQIIALNKSKDEIKQLKVGEAAPSAKIQAVKETLEGTSKVLDKIKSVGESVSEFTSDVAPIVAKALPLLASVKSLIRY